MTPQERIQAAAAEKSIPQRSPKPAIAGLAVLSTALAAAFKAHWLQDQAGFDRTKVAVPSVLMFKNAAELVTAFPSIERFGVGFHAYSGGLNGATLSYFPAGSGVIRVLGSLTLSAQGNPNYVVDVAGAVLYSNPGLAVAGLANDIAIFEQFIADLNL